MSMSTRTAQAAIKPQPTQIALTPTHVEQLQEFHRHHFPDQSVPDISAASSEQQEVDEEDDLGYYTDGVKRTLTDEQIKMFRHSEIQRLLSERKDARSNQEAEADRERRRQKRVHRQPHFDNPGRQSSRVDTLEYDDQPTGETTQGSQGERTFLWPKLGQ